MRSAARRAMRSWDTHHLHAVPYERFRSANPPATGAGAALDESIAALTSSTIRPPAMQAYQDIEVSVGSLRVPHLSSFPGYGGGNDDGPEE